MWPQMNSPLVPPSREQIAATEATAAIHKKGFPPGTTQRVKRTLHEKARRAAVRRLAPSFRHGSRLQPFVYNEDKSNWRDHARLAPAMIGEVRGFDLDGNPRITYRLNPACSGPPLGPSALITLATKKARARQTHPGKRS
jgi:hypothetical protein